jgi:dihydrofolate reductase
MRPPLPAPPPPTGNRKIVAHLQTTLNNSIATAAGTFWEPFPWGQEEIRYLNESFAAADTWALSRTMYDVICPWWDVVASGGVPEDAAELGAAEREFGEIYRGLAKVVFSTTLPEAEGRTVMAGDVAGRLAELKASEGRDIVLSCGPATLAPLAAAPGLIDEYLVCIHPAVVAEGRPMFAGLTADIALELRASRVFDGGAVVLRYGVLA